MKPQVSILRFFDFRRQIYLIMCSGYMDWEKSKNIIAPKNGLLYNININTIMKVKNQNTFYESPLVFIEVVSPEEGFAQSYNDQGLQDFTHITDESGDWN